MSASHALRLVSVVDNADLPEPVRPVAGDRFIPKTGVNAGIGESQNNDFQPGEIKATGVVWDQFGPPLYEMEVVKGNALWHAGDRQMFGAKKLRDHFQPAP